MTAYVCETCGAQFAESNAEPESCPICTDQRQYVPEDGQRWTTLEQLRAERRNVVRAEQALTGVGTEPAFAIGQRALLVPYGESNLMWDCITLIDDESVEEVERRGGLVAIAISHPHYYSGMVEWARAFDCPIYLHADDERWIMRPDAAVELWEGETKQLDHGLTLIRCGGHFAGGTVLHWAGGAALLSGDIVQVIPDRTHVGFMYSYPNLIPLPEQAVDGIVRALEPFSFDTIYGAWWGRLVRQDGKAVVRRSAERYARALRGELPG
jgi:glyoxylase-like metal-dependent hydrolase (beta-lactamase superfamily II)